MDRLTPDQLLMLPLWYAAFLLAVTCHEAAHAWVAKLGGDLTAYSGGQVTLNPLPHIRREPLGTVLVPLITYMLMGWTMGWASAPYDPYWEERHPRRAALMALAGPLANLVLAGLAFAVLKLGIVGGWWVRSYGGLFWTDLTEMTPLAPAWSAGLAEFASICLLINAVLFLFNLFPVPPLDGASVVAGLGRWGAAYRETVRSSFSFMGLLLVWVIFQKVFGPFFSFVVGWL